MVGFVDYDGTGRGGGDDLGVWMGWGRGVTGRWRGGERDGVGARDGVVVVDVATEMVEGECSTHLCRGVSVLHFPKVEGNVCLLSRALKQWTAE